MSNIINHIGGGGSSELEWDTLYEGTASITSIPITKDIETIKYLKIRWVFGEIIRVDYIDWGSVPFRSGTSASSTFRKVWALGYAEGTNAGAYRMHYNGTDHYTLILSGSVTILGLYGRATPIEEDD